MRKTFLRSCVAVISVSMVVSPVLAQTPAPVPGSPPAAEGAAANAFNPEQLDALMAPIALYPDALLTQTLMASAYPLQIVEASRWLASGNNKDLKGDALAKALEPMKWDPSVKSLVPFPQVLEQLNQHLDWTQQLGYAVTTQQAQVMDSVQRLRLQAQQAGTLKTNEQQVVTTQAMMDDQGNPAPQQTIVIQPANPQVVYVPTYNPAVVYGTWPYPATPPVYYPPPPGYAVGSAFLTGMAFAAGVAVVGSLWGWASPRWGYGGGYGGSINVNTNRYNNITVNNVNRGNFSGNNWRAPTQRTGVTPRAPGGPVGSPARINGLPANAVGRANVQVPASALNRANIGTNPARPTAAGQPGLANRPAPGGGVAGTRPTPQQVQQRPTPQQVQQRQTPQQVQQRPTPQQVQKRPTPQQVQQRPTPQQVQRQGGGAFGGVNEGARASQFQQRGAQSRNIQARSGGGGYRRR